MSDVVEISQDPASSDVVLHFRWDTLDHSTAQERVVATSSPLEQVNWTQDTPFNTLPSELVSEVFILCLPATPGPYPGEFPLQFSHICKRWNEIACNTPQLWSYVHLSRISFDEREFQKWVCRSGDLPLHLHVELHHPPHDPSRFLRTTLQHRHRLATLKLSLTGEEISTIVEGIAASASRNTLPLFPNLTSVSLLSHLHKHTINPFTAGVAPRLSEFVGRFCADFLTSAAPPSSSNLRSLRLSQLFVSYPKDVDAIIFALQSSPRLVNLELEFRHVGSAWGDECEKAMITLPNLLSFKLSSTNSVDVLLTKLALPSLKDLDFSYRQLYSRNDFMDGTGLDVLLERSRPPLESLRIIGVSSPNLASYLQRLPHLKSLSGDTALDLLTLSDRMALVPGEKDGTLVGLSPELQEIHYLGRVTRFQQTDYETLIRMMSSRVLHTNPTSSPPPPVLRKVEFNLTVKPRVRDIFVETTGFDELFGYLDGNETVATMKAMGLELVQTTHL